MRNEFALAFNEVLEHYGLPRESVLEVVQAAMVNAYRKAVNASTAQQVEAVVDLAKGTIQILVEKEVVDSVADDRTEVALTEAQKVNPKAQLGDLILIDSTPEDFGRIATQAAKQQIHQKLRDSEREKQFEEWSARKGEIVHGTVQSIGAAGITVSLGRAEAALPKREQLPTERYKPRDRIRAVLMDVAKTSRGPQIILSRADRNMLRRLLEAEVPEIYQGMVEIKGIAREPGLRSKVAVAAMQPNLDPVGACVGMRGGRIQAIVRELHDEKIDVIEWNPGSGVVYRQSAQPGAGFGRLPGRRSGARPDGAGGGIGRPAQPRDRTRRRERAPGGQAHQLAGGHQERGRSRGRRRTKNRQGRNPRRVRRSPAAADRPGAGRAGPQGRRQTAAAGRLQRHDPIRHLGGTDPRRTARRPAQSPDRGGWRKSARTFRRRPTPARSIRWAWANRSSRR